MSAEPLLAIIAGREVDGFLELRWPVKGGMGTSFHDLSSRHCMHSCRREIAGIKERTDVFVGVAPRIRREGGKAAINRSWLLYVDADSAEAAERVQAFDRPPTLVVGSGTGGNVHAYWALRSPIPPAWFHRGNLRLAYHLGTDTKVTDAARILRPPGTLNWKHAPPTAVEVVSYGGATYSFADLVSDIPDPRPPKVIQPRREVRRSDSLTDVPVETYYAVLTGRDPLRGNSQCPLHGNGEERNPSMRLYPATNTWYCFSCEKGGTIYELAADLWGVGTRGEDFLELQRRLREALGVTL